MEMQKKYRTIFLVSLIGFVQLQSADQLSAAKIDLTNKENLEGSFSQYGPNPEGKSEALLVLKNGVTILLRVDDDNGKKYTTEGLTYFKRLLEFQYPLLLKELSANSSLLLPSRYSFDDNHSDGKIPVFRGEKTSDNEDFEEKLMRMLGGMVVKTTIRQRTTVSPRRKSI